MDATILLVWTILSLLVALYAYRKGLSPVFFFLIALLTSPLIGLFAVLAKAPDEDKAAERNGLKKCSNCAEWVKREARTCRFCGNKL